MMPEALVPPSERVFADFPVGGQMPAVVIGPLMVGDQVRWAGATDNYHAEFHHDEQVARALGLPGIILSGPLVGAWMYTALVQWLGQHARITSYYTENREPVMPHDTLHIHARITGRETAAKRGCPAGLLMIECEVRNQDGLKTTPGRACALIPMRPPGRP